MLTVVLIDWCLIDYPYNTVPNKVEHLFQAQLFHDRSVKPPATLPRVTAPKQLTILTPWTFCVRAESSDTLD